MRVLLLALALSLFAVSAGAQSADVYTLKVYAVGAASPQQTYQISTYFCDQEPGTGENVNPTTVIWDDPNLAGRECRALADVVLLSLPVGNYEGTLTRTTSAGVSPESARAPFSRAPRPAAPTGLRYSR